MKANDTSRINITSTRPIKLPKSTLVRILFYSIFCIVFCFSGLLTIITILGGTFNFRMGLVSLLIIPFILIRGFKINKIAIIFVLLSGVIILSGIFNNSSIFEILLFLRILVFSYSIYWLVDNFISPSNFPKIIKICIFIGLLQLPIIVAQRFFYKNLPDILTSKVAIEDFGFGTFNFKDDAAMTFFLIGLCIYLLFNRKNGIITKKWKWLVLIMFTLTVFISDAELAKIILLMVWSTYFITKIHKPSVLIQLLMILIMIVIVFSYGALNIPLARITSIFNSDQNQLDAFLSGNYGRGAALEYYIDRGLLWLGDGPSKYYSAISRTRVLGNTGHTFTFYSEVGIFGWLLSFLFFFLIAFPIRGSRIRTSWVSILLFSSILLLSFTTEVMNDISIVMIYCIIAIGNYLYLDRHQMNGMSQLVPMKTT